jgi:sialate O-acetylesterase
MKAFLLALFALAATAGAAVKLPAVLSDRMVLQQDSPVRIWGWADPGETVTVSFLGQKPSTTAGPDGKWRVFLKPLPAGGSYKMTVSGQNTIELKDILVGEVWIGSGQSNMGVTVARANNPEQEIANANYNQVRLFKVKLTVAAAPAEDVEGSWQFCNPEAVKNFSAIGYFFSRDIHQARSVPVGFIETAWGGTPAEAWTSRPALEAEPALKSVFAEWDEVLAKYPAAKEHYDKQLEAWTSAGKPAASRPREPAGPGHQYTPAGLYNAMIAPITPLAMRGVLWYQGEHNANKGHAYIYRRLFQVLIEDWRRAWGEGQFPFLFVQLANYETGPESAWPVLRESQTKALDLAATGMAVTIDIGESKDIHPKNKQEVARRLALAARAIAYKENVEYSGPIFRQMSSEASQLRAWFDHAGAGLAARDGGALAGFTIAGQDHHFVPAEARIDGNSSVVISSPDVKDPIAVRYAWAGDPVSNLINKQGLPASPFRSDEWNDAK